MMLRKLLTLANLSAEGDGSEQRHDDEDDDRGA